MLDVVDLYLNCKTNDGSLRLLQIFDSSFKYHDDGFYERYLGVSIHRIKLIPIINKLRKKGIKSYSVPINYRDNKTITIDNALDIAKEKFNKNQHRIFKNKMIKNDNPLIWCFSIVSLIGEEKAGGIVMIDRLDGHMWSQEEFEIYMYDYNNVF